LVVVIFTDDVRTEGGRALERGIRERVPDVNVLYVDPRIVDGMTQDVLKAVNEAETVVVAIDEVPVAGRALAGKNGVTNSVGLPEASGELLQKLLGIAAEKTAVVALGNPYLAQDFPAIKTYLCTFSDVSIAETSAVKALFGEIPIHGHLPVTIPDIAV